MIKRIACLWLLGSLAAGAGEGTPIKAERLSALLSPVIYTAPAEVVSANRSRISARIEAQIEQVTVDVGESVAAGQAIAVLDCADHELARERARAELLSARTQLQRARQQLVRSEALARNTLLSEDLLEQRQTEEQAAQAAARRAEIAVDQAELSVSRCRVPSPFEGVVTERLAARGELARPGTALVEIVDLQSVEVAAEVLPAEQAHLDASPKVFLQFLGRDYPLRIDRRTVVIDPVTRTREVRLAFTDAGAPVGAAGRLVWHGKAPGVAASLVVQRRERLGIFIVRDGKAAFHPLPGAREGRPAMVDLPPDTLVVTDGRQGLRDGDTLDIAE